MSYYGSWKINDNLTFSVNTHTPSTGAATNADASPTYHVYEDETATPIITGTMSSLNSPNTVGFYTEQIALSAGNGFEKGKSYNIYVRAVVGGVAGTLSHTFQIEAEVDSNVVSDKTGYSLSNPQNFNLIGNISGSVVGSVSSVVNPVTVGTNNDKTGYSLSSPQFVNISGTITNVFNVLNPVVAGVVTGSVLGNVNGSVGSVVQPVGISTGTFIDALVDRVWDEATSGHQVAGTTGKALTDAGGAGDPWGTPLPGSYTEGQAGHILASRMPTGTVIVSSNQDKTGYSLSSPQNINIVGNISGTIVGNLSGSVGSVTDLGGTLLNKIADYILRRPLASARSSPNGDAVTFRSVLGMASKLVNRWKISGTTLTVYEEDDSTPFETQTLTGTAGADPITEIDTD